MMISLCTLSARDWDFSDLCKRLANQTHKDFEWILIDYLHDLNKWTVKRLAEEHGLNILHLAPVSNKAQHIRDIARNRNLALTHARGDAVIFLDDYTVIDFSFLEKHIKVLSTNRISCGLMYYAIDGASYNLDDAAGLLSVNEVLKSLRHIREFPYTRDSRMGLLSPVNEPQEAMGNEWTYTGNLGIPMAAAIELNGFDPRLTSCGEDCDFGIRAGGMGWKIMFNPEAASINLPTGDKKCVLPFDHEHDLSILSGRGTALIADSNLQRLADVEVRHRPEDRWVAVCNKCGAEYLLNPSEFIYGKKARNEFRVPKILFNLVAERAKFSNPM